MGTTTANGWFYIPAYGSKGPAEFNAFSAALVAADEILGTLDTSPAHKHSIMWDSGGSAQAISIDVSGNVGIGKTADMDGKLDVYFATHSLYAPASALGSSGTHGWVIDKVNTTAAASGLIFAIDGTPEWCLGMDSENEDFVLVYEVGVGDQLRVKTGGKFVMGYSVGSPNVNRRLEINMGDTETIQTLLQLVKTASGTLENFISCYNGSSYPFNVDYLGNLTCATCYTVGPTMRIATPVTIANANDAGTIGMIAWDTNYIYVCVATNTWKRAALSTWP